MTIVERYSIAEIIKFFCIVLTAVVTLYIAVDFFQSMDNFMRAEIPLTRMFTYFLLKLPLIIQQMSPICILLSVLTTFGLMNKNNEIIALKSSGVSVYYLLRPVLVLGFVFSVLLFLLAEVIVPVTVSRSNRIWLLEVKKQWWITSRPKNIWIKGNRSIYYINYYDPQKNTISGVALNYFDSNFRLVKRVDAQRGAFQEGQWILFNIMEQVLDKKTGDYMISFHHQHVAQVDFLPQDLKRAVKRSEEMNVKELYAYIQTVESEGYDATIYRVDFHSKFAMPLVCVIISIIGTGIAVKRRIGEGLSVSIAYGVAMVFLYWVSHSLCLSLGYGGVLPPVVAAWISNVLFTCLGFFNLINAE